MKLPLMDMNGQAHYVHPLTKGDNMKFAADRLKALREAKEWSQEELGDRLGLSRVTISSLERNKYAPNIDLINRIAAVFGVEPVFFIVRGE